MSPLSEDTLEVSATLEQVLTGLPMGQPGSTGKGQCHACGVPLRDGACVTVYVYQTAGNAEWKLPAVYCDGCHSSKIETPTLGATEAVISAFIGVAQYAARQTTRFILSNVTLEDVSPPSDGSPP